MGYQKLNWLNKGETGAIPINKDNLNHMDNGIADSNIFRNLFNVGNAKMTTNADLTFDNSNNKILINGSSTTSTNILLNSPNGKKDKDGIILAPGTYTATIRKKSGSLSNNEITFYLRKNNGSNLYDGTPIFIQNIDVGVSDNTTYSSTFTLTEETRLHWIGYFSEKQINFNNLTLEFQIEESSQVTDYVPFAGYIVESGSNNYGSWIKYSDRTMICWMRAENTVNYQASGALYVGYLTNIVFPQKFASSYTPMCFAQNNGLNEIITGQIERIDTTKITRIQCWRVSAANTFTILNILAIGRWE